MVLRVTRLVCIMQLFCKYTLRKGVYNCVTVCSR